MDVSRSIALFAVILVLSSVTVLSEMNTTDDITTTTTTGPDLYTETGLPSTGIPITKSTGLLNSKIFKTAPTQETQTDRSEKNDSVSRADTTFKSSPRISTTSHVTPSSSPSKQSTKSQRTKNTSKSDNTNIPKTGITSETIALTTTPEVSKTRKEVQTRRPTSPATRANSSVVTTTIISKNTQRETKSHVTTKSGNPTISSAYQDQHTDTTSGESQDNITNTGRLQYVYDEFDAGDKLWPVGMALTIGVPTIIVFAVTITVLYKRQVAKPRSRLSFYGQNYAKM